MAFRFFVCAALAAAPACPAWGQPQDAAAPDAATDAAPTQTVTVTGRGTPGAAIGGFGDVPLARAPFAATVIGPQSLADAGVTNLADIARTTAGVSDGYNALGYWSNFTVRGFMLDPRNNYRRDGLPINAETALWLGNVSSIEVLRGTSGMQAGVSAPGGLVNLVVKRPVGTLRSATLGVEQRGSVLLGLDVGDRAGAGGEFGWRISAEHERLDPLLRDARGSRQGVAAAGEWRLSDGARLEGEVALNRQSQPSQAGYSLLGTRVPDARSVDPRINLNDQPWTLPVVFGGTTGSLRWAQPLAPTLQFVAHAMAQRLRTDDRMAFPFGCSAENTFDRYCSDGRFDVYDYRSEGERRRNDAVDLGLRGSTRLLAQEHRWQAGVQWSRRRAALPDQAYNYVGTGTVDGSSITPADPTPIAGSGSARNERSTELYLRDEWALTPAASLWLGLRHTRLQRSDSSSQIDANQRFTTPWLAASLRLDARTTVYASAGEGVESTVVPNLPAVYAHAGQPLPALKSRQLEAGIKHEAGALSASAALFDVRRPLFSDLCGVLCERVLDGQQRHRGIELDASWRAGAWTLHAGATALRARRERSIDPAHDALKPTNVPERTLRAQLDHQLGALPGLTLTAGVQHEGSRYALPDNSAAIPSWTRLDLAARFVQRIGAPDTTLTWRLGVDNATNRRAWREAPYQFGHAYLYPLAPRTWRASVQAAF